jgi:hypothetical protein
MYYSKVKKILALAFKGDDLMDQEALFEMQESIARLALEVANAEGKTSDLVNSFKYLYTAK